MTLASILLISVFSAPLCARYPAPMETMQQSGSMPDQPSATAKQPQNSGSASSTENSRQNSAKAPNAAPQSSSSQGKTARKPNGKKNVSVSCDNGAAQNSAKKSSSSSSPAGAAGKKSASTAPSNCPPTKVIVRQGSTTEPSIQVLGGAEGSQASDERNTAIKMLETTEANLKKMEGSQLDTNQQDVIKQVRQFMDQSKAANSSGNLDQARTLAWKAQLLSEELLKTQK